MTQSDHAPMPRTASAPSNRCFPRLVRVFLSAMGVGVVAGGIAYFCQTTKFEATGVLHIRPVITSLLFNIPGTLPNFDQFLQTQAAILRNERCVDLAMNSPTWLRKDSARQNSVPARLDFMKNLRVITDGEMIRVSYLDPDPKTASDAVAAIIDAYQELMTEIDPDQPLRRRQQLENLKADYEKKLDDARRKIAELASPYTPELLEARLTYKANEANQAETEMTQSRAAVENWKALHSDQAAPNPVDPPLQQLEAKASLDSRRFQDVAVEVTKLGHAAAEIHEIVAEQQQNADWLKETRQKLEELRVRQTGPGRLLILSRGEHPVSVESARLPLAAGVGGAAFLVTLLSAGLMRQRVR